MMIVIGPITKIDVTGSTVPKFVCPENAITITYPTHYYEGSLAFSTKA